MEIKKHFKENKKFYIGVGVGIAITGITCLIMRGKFRSGCGYSQSGGQIVDTVKPHGMDFSNFSISGNKNSIGTVTTTHNYDRKTPLSYIVSENGTSNWWVSQAEAARATGISEPNLSKHLNHGKSLDDGRKFIRQGVAT